MTEQPDAQIIPLSSDVDEVVVKPHFDGQLTVVVSHNGYDRHHQARAVTVHGDGRLELHNGSDGTALDGDTPKEQA